MITKENCEAYFLDYHEGNLSVEDTAELMLFLEQHSEYKEDFDSYEVLQLEVSQTAFENKAGIKKKVGLNEEDYIAYIEKVADNKTISKVEEALKLSSAVQKEIELFKKTILVPDLIEYPDKNNLKRKETKVLPMYYALAAAAAIAILLIATFVFNNKVETTPTFVETQESISNDNSIAFTEKEESKILEPVTSKTLAGTVQSKKYTQPTLVQSSSIKKSKKKDYYQLVKNNVNSIPSNSSGYNSIASSVIKVDATSLLPDIVEESTSSSIQIEKLTLKEQLIAQKTDIKSGKPKKEERLLLFANITKNLFKKAPVKTQAEYDEYNNIVAYSVDFRNIHFEKK